MNLKKDIFGKERKMCEQTLEKDEIQKTVEESRVETVHIIRPTHLNGAGRLFGGILMQWLDEVAGVVAKRHCCTNVSTASVDNLSFIRGAYARDVVVIIGELTHVGNTSMEVKVDTYFETQQGKRELINRAYFTLVALGKDDRPIPVPRLKIMTAEQQAEWEAGEKRRQMRKMRNKEGF